MAYEALFNPRSIVVVGASRDRRKIGGKILHNLLAGGYRGKLYGINPTVEEISGVPCPSLADLPDCDLAIICVPAAAVEDYVLALAEQHAVKAFIVTSAGFAELGGEHDAEGEGTARQQRLLALVNLNGGSLIGPNCTGMLTPSYAGIFAGPIPELDSRGCDFVSASGATAAFITEQGILQGLAFSSIISVGNSAQIGVEEILAYWDASFDPDTSSRIKLLYLETVRRPDLLLRHAASLRRKGCVIAAVKAGTTAEGQRAASSHTGALSSPDTAVKALFRKAGIVVCKAREELVSAAVLARCGISKGSRVGIATHAGGPGVLLTDTLSHRGLKVPELTGDAFNSLLTRLHHGSSVRNPIDFLATGSAEQLIDILETLEQSGSVDSAAVIFGSPGLVPVDDVYQALGTFIERSTLPVYPVFPSPITAGREMNAFSEQYRIPWFIDESQLGKALSAFHTAEADFANAENVSKAADASGRAAAAFDPASVRMLVHSLPDGYVEPDIAAACIRAAGISTVDELITTSVTEAVDFFRRLAGPVAMKAVGPLHKSDSGGVLLYIDDEDAVVEAFNRIFQRNDTRAVLVQPMVEGRELFIGAVHEPGFGHLVFCGLGGVFVEVLNDTASALAPVSAAEARAMIAGLRGCRILQGVRGIAGIDLEAFVRAVAAVSDLVTSVPEISELDINPLIAEPVPGGRITAVDYRLKLGRL